MSTDLASLTGIDVPTGLLIGGEWTNGQGQQLAVVDPATEEVLAEVADGTEQDGLAAVTAAYEALPKWAATPPRQRAECLRRAFELMTSRAEAFARLMTAENGKSLRDARAEVTYAAEFFRWYSEEAVRIDGNLTTAPVTAVPALPATSLVGNATVIEEAVLNALTGTLDVGIDYPLPTSNVMPTQETTPARPNVP